MLGLPWFEWCDLLWADTQFVEDISDGQVDQVVITSKIVLFGHQPRVKMMYRMSQISLFKISMKTSLLQPRGQASHLCTFCATKCMNAWTREEENIRCRGIARAQSYSCLFILFSTTNQDNKLGNLYYPGVNIEAQILITALPGLQICWQ